MLRQAATLTDPMQRIMYVAAFAVSGYASTANRPSRKPFNPLLGETYEWVQPQTGTSTSERDIILVIMCPSLAHLHAITAFRVLYACQAVGLFRKRCATTRPSLQRT